MRRGGEAARMYVRKVEEQEGLPGWRRAQERCGMEGWAGSVMGDIEARVEGRGEWLLG